MGTTSGRERKGKTRRLSAVCACNNKRHVLLWRCATVSRAVATGPPTSFEAQISSSNSNGQQQTRARIAKERAPLRARWPLPGTAGCCRAGPAGQPDSLRPAVRAAAVRGRPPAPPRRWQTRRAAPPAATAWARSGAASRPRCTCNGTANCRRGVRGDGGHSQWRQRWRA